MALLGLDLGGTKISLAVFNENGDILEKETIALNKRKGKEVGELIEKQINKFKKLGYTNSDRFY